MADDESADDTLTPTSVSFYWNLEEVLQATVAADLLGFRFVVVSNLQPDLDEDGSYTTEYTLRIYTQETQQN